MTQAGDLNQQLDLERQDETSDGAGGVTLTYSSVATLWAQITALSARADIAAASLGAAVSHRIVIRAGIIVTTRHRFRDGVRIFRVVGTRDSADRAFLIVDALERED